MDTNNNGIQGNDSLQREVEALRNELDEVKYENRKFRFVIENSLVAQAEIDASGAKEYLASIGITTAGSFLEHLSSNPSLGAVLFSKCSFTFCNQPMLEIFRAESPAGVKEQIAATDAMDWGPMSNVLKAFLNGKKQLELNLPLSIEPGIKKRVYINFIQGIDDSWKNIHVCLFDKSDNDKMIVELEATKNRFLGIANTLPETIFEIDQNRRFTFVSEKGLQDFGYSQQDIDEGVYIEDVIIPQEHQRMYAEFQQRAETNKDTNREYTAIAKDGTRFPVLVSSKPVMNNGNFEGLIGIVINLSEKKYIENMLQRLNTAINQVPLAVIITNLKGKIEFVNPQFTEVTGYDRDEVLGKNINVLKSGKMDDDVYNELWQNLRKGQEWSGEFINRKKNGDHYWAGVVISPVKSEKGEVTGYIAIQDDISSRKTMESDLLAAKRKAEESDRLKTSLLSNMSHEFRTPMNGILGLASVLEKKVTDTEVKGIVNDIKLSGRRLMAALNSVIELSQFESVSHELIYKTLNLSELVKGIVEHYRHMAEAKGLSLKFIDEAPGTSVKVVPDLLIRVLENLLDNAVKYTDAGKITVEVDTREVNSEMKGIISVADTGTGIAPEDCDVIFSAFRQASEGLSRRHDGAGLGLTLSKKMVETMGGEISFASEQGKGSTFSISFPHTEGAQAEAAEENSYGVNSKSGKKPLRSSAHRPDILLVEDNAINREVAVLFVEDYYAVDWADSGEKALEMVKRKRYDAVLLDIHLGAGLSGLDVLKELRKKPSTSHIPVVAITGYAMAQDKKKLLAAGCDEYLVKPFEQDEILDVLNSLLSQTDEPDAGGDQEQETKVAIPSEALVEIYKTARIGDYRAVKEQLLVLLTDYPSEKSRINQMLKRVNDFDLDAVVETLEQAIDMSDQ